MKSETKVYHVGNVAVMSTTKRTVLFSFSAPKQPMTRPYAWVVIQKLQLMPDGEKRVPGIEPEYVVTQKFSDERGGQGNGYYTRSFNDALEYFNKKVARDAKFFASEWERSLAEIGLLPGC